MAGLDNTGKMLAICGGKVYTMDGTPLERGCVLIEKGKIVAVGQSLPIPDGCEVFDATGKVVTPGLIDAHTHLGVYAEPTEWSAEDGNETSGPVTPAMMRWTRLTRRISLLMMRWPAA